MESAHDDCHPNCRSASEDSSKLAPHALLEQVCNLGELHGRGSGEKDGEDGPKRNNQKYTESDENAR